MSVRVKENLPSLLQISPMWQCWPEVSLSSKGIFLNLLSTTLIMILASWVKRIDNRVAKIVDPANCIHVILGVPDIVPVYKHPLELQGFQATASWALFIALTLPYVKAHLRTSFGLYTQRGLFNTKKSPNRKLPKLSRRNLCINANTSTPLR